MRIRAGLSDSLEPTTYSPSSRLPSLPTMSNVFTAQAHSCEPIVVEARLRWVPFRKLSNFIVQHVCAGERRLGHSSSDRLPKSGRRFGGKSTGDRRFPSSAIGSHSPVSIAAFSGAGRRDRFWPFGKSRSLGVEAPKVHDREDHPGRRSSRRTRDLR